MFTILDYSSALEYSIITDLNIDMIETFPLDYLHVVLLGVTRKTILLWMRGSLKFRIGPRVKTEISESLISYRSYICREFARKTRALIEIDRWKAT